jgi:hypothetical protein
MKRGRFVAAAIIPALAAWAVALALMAGTAMAASSRPAPSHTAARHTAARHTAARHTAARHTAARHTAARRRTEVRAARHARAAAPPVVFNCVPGQVRPRTFILTCADRNDYLTRLSWSAWSSAFASGTGTQMINACAPDCSVGTFHSFPVDVVFWHSAPVPRHPGKRYFSRVTVLYPVTRPPTYRHAKPQTGPETWTGSLAG